MLISILCLWKKQMKLTELDLPLVPRVILKWTLWSMSWRHLELRLSILAMVSYPKIHCSNNCFRKTTWLSLDQELRLSSQWEIRLLVKNSLERLTLVLCLVILAKSKMVLSVSKSVKRLVTPSWSRPAPEVVVRECVLPLTTQKLEKDFNCPKMKLSVHSVMEEFSLRNTFKHQDISSSKFLEICMETMCGFLRESVLSNEEIKKLLKKHQVWLWMFILEKRWEIKL